MEKNLTYVYVYLYVCVCMYVYKLNYFAVYLKLIHYK